MSRRTRWISAGFILFAVIVAGGQPLLDAAEFGWPKWIVPVVGAVAGAAVALVQPLWENRLERQARRTRSKQEREDELEGQFGRIIGGDGTLPRVHEVRNSALFGIHTAVPLPRDAPASLSRDLPTYVSRDADAELRSLVSAATTGSGFVLIMGRATAGKTRSAFEAVQSLAPDWGLYLPSRATELNSLAENGTRPAKTVIWLDEAQRFLGELSPATVRFLLADPRQPVLIIGTIWPSLFDKLRKPSSPDGQEPTAAEVLRMARRVDWSDQFSDAEWSRARALTTGDPRLADATRSNRSAGLPATLAGAPELIFRWMHGEDPAGVAVISAAVDARRFGHQESIPEDILRELTKLYLPADKADDPAEYDRGIAWACEPVIGTVAAMTVEDRPDRQSRFCRVSDVLLQHAEDSPVVPPIPRPVVDFIAKHANRIASEALNDGYQIDVFRAFWELGAEAGDPVSMNSAGTQRFMQHDWQGARVLFERAAVGGDLHAMANLAATLIQLGEPDAARDVLSRAAAKGDPKAMMSLARMADDIADQAEYEHWIALAAEAGDHYAMRLHGENLLAEGDPAAALPWVERSLSGGKNVRLLLARIKKALGDDGAARQLVQDAVNIEDEEDARMERGTLQYADGEKESAMVLRRDGLRGCEMAELETVLAFLIEHDDPASARRLLDERAEQERDSPLQLGFAAYEARFVPEARKFWMTAAEVDDDNYDAADRGHAMFALGVSSWDIDTDAKQARYWYKRAIKAGFVNAMTNLAWVHQASGQPRRAKRWYTRAAATGEPNAIAILAGLEPNEVSTSPTG